MAFAMGSPLDPQPALDDWLSGLTQNDPNLMRELVFNPSAIAQYAIQQNVPPPAGPMAFQDPATAGDPFAMSPPPPSGAPGARMGAPPPAPAPQPPVPQPTKPPAPTALPPTQLASSEPIASGTALDPMPEQPAGAPMDIRSPVQQQQDAGGTAAATGKPDLKMALQGLRQATEGSGKAVIPSTPSAPHADVRGLGRVDADAMIKMMSALRQPGISMLLPQLLRGMGG